MIPQKEAAELLGVSSKALCRWSGAGSLPSRRLGNRRYPERGEPGSLPWERVE